MFRKATEIAFLLLIFSLGFMQPNIFVSNLKTTITEVAFVAVAMLFTISFLRSEIKLNGGSFYFPLLIYAGSLVISTIFSESPHRSATKLVGEFYLIGLAVIGFNLVSSMRFAKSVIASWLVATGIACAVSVVTFLLFYFNRDAGLLTYTLSHYGSLPSGNYPRIHSTFANANMFCNYLNVSAIFILVAERLKLISPRIFVLLFSILVFAAFFTLSPGLGGIAMSIGLWCGFRLRELNKHTAAKISFGVGAIAALLIFASTLISPANLRESEPSARVLTWRSSLKTFHDHHVVGRGIGLDAANVTYNAADGHTQFLGDAHQMWLNVAAQQGIIGLFAISFLSYFFLKKIWPIRLGEDNREALRSAFGLSFLGAFIYQGLIGSFEDARHLWVLIGLIGAITDSKREL